MSGHPQHSFHLVEPSPWPFVGAMSGFIAAVGGIMYMHELAFGGYILIAGFLSILATMFFWWRDIVREAEFQGHHNPVVQLGMRYGMILFIASEVMFFAAFFWAFFDSALYPDTGVWPPEGIVPFDAWDLPLINTMILLLSGCTVTWAHHALIENKRDQFQLGLGLTVLLGALFTVLQAYEYSHAAFAFIDPGDIALIPDPAYPVYGVGTMFAGAESHIMPLYERNGWLPELDAIPGPVVDAAKLMWLNYPNNPTSAVATHEDLASAVAYCREKDNALLHDAAYSEVGYEGYRATSCMQVDGAKDVSLEFHSLSKTYNMPGWRIGFMCGNAKLIAALGRIKSYLDYGTFTPVQVAAIAAMNGPQDCVDEIRETYRRRRDVLCDGLNQMGWPVERPRATMFVWARIPEAFRAEGSLEFSKRLLAEARVAVSPGVGFGHHGDEHVRIALIENEHRTRQALRGIRKMMERA